MTPISSQPGEQVSLVHKIMQCCYTSFHLPHFLQINYVSLIKMTIIDHLRPCYLLLVSFKHNHPHFTSWSIHRFTQTFLSITKHDHTDPIHCSLPAFLEHLLHMFIYPLFTVSLHYA